MLCFSDTEAAPVFSLKIPLFAPSTFQMKSDQPSELSTSPAHSEVVSNQMGSRSAQLEDDNKADEIGQEGAHETMESPTDDTNSKPFALTDEDIDAMIEALWRAPHVAPPPMPPVVSPDIDDDLREVLGMDIGDFLV